MASLVPSAWDGHGQEPVGRLLLYLGHAIVVDLHRDPAQVCVGHAGQPLAAETDGAGIDDLGVYPETVQHRDALSRVVGARVGLLDHPHRQRFGRGSLAPVSADDRPGDGLPDGHAVHHPNALTLDDLVVRHAVLEMGRSQTGEEVAGLGPLRIGVHHELLAEHRSHGHLQTQPSGDGPPGQRS